MARLGALLCTPRVFKSPIAKLTTAGSKPASGSTSDLFGGESAEAEVGEHHLVVGLQVGGIRRASGRAGQPKRILRPPAEN